MTSPTVVMRETPQRSDIVTLTLLDYYMAHAPAVPEWFIPKMPECPVVPSMYAIQDDAVRQDVQEAINTSGDPTTEAGAQWIESERRGRDLQAAWQAEFRRQNLIQWPLAWAEMMLTERARC